jgi:hypothetical protein
MRKALPQLLSWMPALTALGIPVHPRLSALSLGIWTVLALAAAVSGMIKATPESRASKPPIAFSWIALGSVAYYVCLMLGMLWTSNASQGWFALEVKFSFLLLPVLFWQVNLLKDGSWKAKASSAFQWGLLIFLISRVGHALWYQDWSMTRYGGFAGDFHPSYMAFYLITGILYASSGDRIGKVLLLAAGLAIGILASKAGWGCGALVIVIELVRRFRRTKGKSLFLVASGVLLIAGAVWADGGRFHEFQTFMRGPSGAEERTTSMSTDRQMSLTLKQEKSIQKTGSTGGRMQAWSASVDLIAHHPFGVGTGDVSEALMTVYKREGALYAQQKNMNPHSVWLLAGVRLGWAVLLGMLIWWGGLLVVALKMKNQLLAVWCIAFMLNATVESFFELQQGVVAVLFLGLLFASNHQK